MSDLPQQAQAALAEAERIEQELVTPADPAPPPTPQEPEPPPAPEPTPPPAPISEETAEYWKGKFHTMQGMHRVEIDKVKDLQTQVSNLTSQLAAAKAAIPEKKPEPTKLVTDKDAEAYGEDLIDLIGRKAREIADEQTGELRSQVAALQTELATTKGKVDTVATTETSRSQTTFLSDLGKQVPDWEAVNANQLFLDWCAGTDPLSGQQRQALMDDAVEKFDANRVAALFNAFKSTQPPVVPPPVVPDTIEQHITPGQKHTPNPPPEPLVQGKIWTGDEIEKFYAALVRGDYKGREVEAKAIEAQIDQSLAASQ